MLMSDLSDCLISQSAIHQCSGLLLCARGNKMSAIDLIAVLASVAYLQAGILLDSLQIPRPLPSTVRSRSSTHDGQCWVPLVCAFLPAYHKSVVLSGVHSLVVYLPAQSTRLLFRRTGCAYRCRSLHIFTHLHCSHLSPLLCMVLDLV